MMKFYQFMDEKIDDILRPVKEKVAADIVGDESEVQSTIFEWPTETDELINNAN